MARAAASTEHVRSLLRAVAKVASSTVSGATPAAAAPRRSTGPGSATASPIRITGIPGRSRSTCRAAHLECTITIAAPSRKARRAGNRKGSRRPVTPQARAGRAHPLRDGPSAGGHEAVRPPRARCLTSRWWSTASCRTTTVRGWPSRSSSHSWYGLLPRCTSWTSSSSATVDAGTSGHPATVAPAGSGSRLGGATTRTSARRPSSASSSTA
jgi:hypothetical protein